MKLPGKFPIKLVFGFFTFIRSWQNISELKTFINYIISPVPATFIRPVIKFNACFIRSHKHIKIACELIKRNQSDMVDINVIKLTPTILVVSFKLVARKFLSLRFFLAAFSMSQLLRSIKHIL